MNHAAASLEKNRITLTEYSDGTFEYTDKFFVKCSCVGFYLTKQDLKDLQSVINYYFSVDEIEDIKISIGGEYVTK